ncbi:MAG: RNP-1 like RNA-binding protein [Halothiobacillaceae bacterium]|nr:MAG: RNP-1 like RNA-binding protein [Halothiobacillaceae bacterium]
MKAMFVGNIAAEATEGDVKELFAQYGTIRSIKLASDIFTGKCKGFALIEMEGHEARAAIAGLNGKEFKGRALRVSEEDGKKRGNSRQRR